MYKYSTDLNDIWFPTGPVYMEVGDSRQMQRVTPANVIKLK